MIGTALKAGLLIGGAWVIGDKLGAWIAIKTGQLPGSGAMTGIKVGTGVATFALLGAVLR